MITVEELTRDTSSARRRELLRELKDLSRELEQFKHRVLGKQDAEAIYNMHIADEDLFDILKIGETG